MELYKEWKNVSVRKRNEEEKVKGEVKMKKLGRMCVELDINIIEES